MNGLSERNVAVIRGSWAQVAPIADQAATLFYGRLFDLDPDLKGLFTQVDMAEQRAKLLSALSLAVEALDDLEGLAPALETLGARHAGFGVQPAHYDTVGAALLWTLEQGLGEAFTPEVKSAWTVAYALISGIMREAGDAAAYAA